MSGNSGKSRETSVRTEIQTRQNLEFYPFTIVFGLKAECYVVFPLHCKDEKKLVSVAKGSENLLPLVLNSYFRASPPPSLAQPILCHGIYCALCLARSSPHSVKNASIGPEVRKEKSIHLHDGRLYVTARQARWTCYTTSCAELPMEQHVMTQNYTTCERGRVRVMEGNKMFQT